MTAGTDLRLLRAAVFTAACVGLSAGAHVFAAGRTVPLWTLGAGCAAVFAVAVTLAGRERSLPGIATVLAVGQLSLHLILSAGHTPTGGAAAPRGTRALAAQLLCGDRSAAALSDASAQRVLAGAGLAGHGSGHGGAAPPPGVADGTAGSPRTVLEPALAQLSLPMLLGHLLAALAAGWLLRRGEAALWRLVRLSADTLSAVSLRRSLALARTLLRGGPACPAPPRTAPPPPDRAVPPRTRVLTGAATRRGPPPGPSRLALAA